MNLGPTDGNQTAPRAAARGRTDATGAAFVTLGAVRPGGPEPVARGTDPPHHPEPVTAAAPA